MARLRRDLDGALEDLLRVGILRAQIHEAARRADRKARDRHAFDEDERIALHDHPIRERPGVAFVGIADDVFLRRLRFEHGLPLDARRKRCAATPAKP
jgi:hypothetical protein